MPPRKPGSGKSRFCGKMKAKSRIVKRLLQISLVADKYIYMHQPISKPQAFSYLGEVVSLKAQCDNDEECLQVTEKLSRIMQAIIEEKNTYSTSNWNTSQNTQYESYDVTGASPVYSVTEEDKELTCNNIYYNANYISNENEFNYMDKTQNNKMPAAKVTTENQFITTIKENHVPTSNQDIDVIDLCSSGKSYFNHNGIIYDNHNNFNNKEYLDGSDEEIATIIKNINISQIQIRNTLEDSAYSQSILNNVSFLPEIITEEQCGQGMAEIDREIHLYSDPIHLQDNVANEKSLTTHREVIENGEHRLITNTNNDFEQSLQISETNKTLYVLKNVTFNKSTQKKQIKRVKRTGKTQLDEKNVQKNTKPKRKPVNRRRKNVETKVNTPTTDAKQNTKVNSETTRQNIKVNADVNNDLYLQTAETLLGATNTAKYNVHQDLSWIENIRYVREIAVDEYVNNDYSEDFWKNFDLPLGWDDKDFDS